MIFTSGISQTCDGLFLQSHLMKLVCFVGIICETHGRICLIWVPRQTYSWLKNLQYVCSESVRPPRDQIFNEAIKATELPVSRPYYALFRQQQEFQTTTNILTSPFSSGISLEYKEVHLTSVSVAYLAFAFAAGTPYLSKHSLSFGAKYCHGS